VNNIKFPVLYCPFHAAINPHCDAAYQHTLNWMHSFNFATDESVYKTLLAGKFHVLVARAYPYASLEDMEIITDLMFWNFFIDDQFEKAGISKRPEILEPLKARLVEVIKKDAELTDIDTPTVRAWRDFMQRLHHHPSATSECVLRFAKHIEGYFQAIYGEALNNSQGMILDVATFMKVRSFTIAAYPYMDLILMTDQIALPPEVFKHPIVKRLELATINIIAWSNDLFSFNKEMNAGHNNFNLVTVLQQEYQVSLQQAFDHAAELHNTEVQLFIDLSAQVPSFGTEIDANLERYLLGLRFWIRANLDWSAQTRRYKINQAA
jgi:5-epi-alpha-selinene synthase